MLRDYPRPQLKRDNWINLNGTWDFEFDDHLVGIKEEWYKNHDFKKKIQVPFAYQSKLSGINDRSCHDYVWYHLNFKLDKPIDKQVILHFEAIDYEATIYLNGKQVAKHIGGSSSFSVDITSSLETKASQDLTILVYDPSHDSFISRGKQSWKEGPFECFYDRTTGIWQTVWIEYIDKSSIKDMHITPNIDDPSVNFFLESYNALNKTAKISIKYDNKEITQKTVDFTKKACVDILIEESKLHLWSPENPNLYDVSIEVFVDKKLVDSFSSYFGMRKVSIEKNQILLNNKPYYLRLILDQGYYPDGLVSYLDEETLLDDIKLSKQMGFNGCRKHEKVEARRFMYYADKLGYLVSLEMPSAYSYKASQAFLDEWVTCINRDYNHPSLFMYVPFNESWGIRKIKNNLDIQNYVNGFYYLTKSLDKTRIISTNDGWEQTLSDICAIHTYQHGGIKDYIKQTIFDDSICKKELLLSSIHTKGERDIYLDNYKYNEEPIILSEFGGISYANHKQDGWGYTGVNNKKDLEWELKRIFKVIYKSKHLAGFCYTQLTDVEQEINGLLDYNRKEKIPIEIIKKIICNE